MKWIRRAFWRRFYRLLDRSPVLARWYAVRQWKQRGQRPFVEWQPIVGEPARWKPVQQPGGDRPNVLLASVVGGHQVGTIVESVLAVALTLRGAEVHVLLCDTELPACFQCTVKWYPRLGQFVKHGPQQDLCYMCYEPGAATFRALGVRIHRYSEYLTEEDRALAARVAAALPAGELATCRHQDYAVGEHALAGALRFFGRASLDGERHGEAVLRRYVHAALLTVLAMRRLLAAVPVHSAVFHHGLYVPHGLIGEVCRQAGVPVVNWGATYRQQCFIFSHGDTYHHTMLDEPTAVWETMPWTPEMAARIQDYLKSRWHGTRDWIRVHDDPNTDLAAINRELGIDPARPSVGLLTNVMWDAQVCYPANAFPTMRDWVFTTIRYFARRPELQLIVRVHPAEAHRGPLQARQLILREIEEKFPTLPPNIILIPAGSRVSTYAVMGQCNAVLVFATKAGVELAATGMPVIVAGEAWVRNKGITRDARSEAEYLRLLDELPYRSRLDAGTTERALKYAYHFFFRRMIPLELVQRPKPDGALGVTAAGMEEFLPGRHLGLDVICNGILHQAPFVYPAEAIAGDDAPRARPSIRQSRPYARAR